MPDLLRGPLRGAGAGRELGFQRYDKVVEALGGYGELVTRAEDIRPALDRALASNKPALVNVQIDPDTPASGGLLGALGSSQATKQVQGGFMRYLQRIRRLTFPRFNRDNAHHSIARWNSP